MNAVGTQQNAAKRSKRTIMTKNEEKMLSILRELKEKYNAIGIRGEFEAEGSRINELMLLSRLGALSSLKLFIKVGGCEAISDIRKAKELGAYGILAPMIESGFAVKKFKEAIRKVYGSGYNVRNFENVQGTKNTPKTKKTEYISNEPGAANDIVASKVETIINIETVTGCENLKSILKEGQGEIDTVSIGRVDLSASLGIDRSGINSDKILSITKDIMEKSKQYGYKVNFGGGISEDAIPFIEELFPLNDRFETRKIVFNLTTLRDDTKKMEKECLKSSTNKVTSELLKNGSQKIAPEFLKSDLQKINPEFLKSAIKKAMEFELLYLENKRNHYEIIAKEDEERIEMLRKRI